MCQFEARSLSGIGLASWQWTSAHAPLITLPTIDKGHPTRPYPYALHTPSGHHICGGSRTFTAGGRGVLA